ncbi:hypothetical protein BD560DRAFT_219123 [Blakeslea trispora]|nr:hypothetical protein BD560DRAFT_219123 [Blakeslea trispora]
MPITKLRRKVTQDLLKEKQVSTSKWSCCNLFFDTIVDIGKHVHTNHQNDLDMQEQAELRAQQSIQQQKENIAKLKQRRGEKGTSDSISIECQCNIEEQQVILFYRYTKVDDPVQFALDHQEYCVRMTGKVRIASEGINATLAGSKPDIRRYLDWLTHSAQPFKDLPELKDNEEARFKFFKPSEGCIHVFDELSIKLVDEICPLGQSTVMIDTLNTSGHRHGKLSPDAFHNELLSGSDFVLMDTRNYYESNIGHFENAIRPPIRKFSQLPAYIERNKHLLEGKRILTYCTGGIRCEKATAYMRQALPENDIFMLDGGIHNYLEWHKQSEQKESVWLGKNYVFDARQSLGSGPIVSYCQSCRQPWDQYKKCMSSGCHLLVLLCDPCCQRTNTGIYCCTECQQQNQTGNCCCEKKRREKELELIEM